MTGISCQENKNNWRKNGCEDKQWLRKEDDVAKTVFNEEITKIALSRL